jgi:tetratricopeptide (TPR) repeat protein
VELARRSGLLPVLATALRAFSHSLWGTPDVERRIDVASELISIEEELGPSVMEPQGYYHRAVARLELGDLAGWRLDLPQWERMLLDFGRRPMADPGSDFADVEAALIDGRLAEAETLLDRFPELLAESEAVDGVNIYAGQLVWLRREQGRAAELLPLIEAAVKDNPAVIAFRAALARGYADVGNLEDAKEHFEILARDGFAHVPHDQTWPVSLGLLSEVCAVLGDCCRAEILYDLFRPHTGHLALVVGGSITVGAVDRYLGMLAATIGRERDAEAHYEAALRFEEALPSRPNLARTQMWYVRLLAGRDNTDDHSRAEELARRSLEAAEDLGMASLANEARGFLAHLAESA